MKSYYLLILVLSVFIFAPLLATGQADPFANLTYPIPELGNCKSRQDCEAYCEKPANMETCLNFAETHELLPKEDVEMGRRMLTAGDIGGPGGCKGMVACETYCDDINHLEECLLFAEEYDLIPADELEDAQKVVQAMKKGIKPPPCKKKSDCDVYCSDASHIEECITFGEAAGLIPADELQEAKKMLEAVRKGAKPPACQGKKQCDIYCSEPEHMEECIEFGIAAGFMPPEEEENAKKTLQAIKQGIKLPNCRGKEECDVYCQEAEHMEECMNFAIAAGFMPEEEIENAKKMLNALKQGIKPPNCQGEEECNIYCQEPEHMAECTEFAIAAGFMPEEEIENAKKTLEAIKKGVMPPNCRGEEECQAYCSQPEHMEECINFAEASGFMSPEDAERARQGGQIMQRGGPGGCKSEQECQAYCQDPNNAEQCIRFSVEQGMMSPEEGEEMIERMRTAPSAPPEGMMGPPPGGGGEGMMGQPPEGGMPPGGQMPPEGIMGPSPEGMPFPGPAGPGGAGGGGMGQPPTPEEIEGIQQQMMQQEIDRQMQQIQEQIQQQMPTGPMPPIQPQEGMAPPSGGGPTPPAQFGPQPSNVQPAPLLEPGPQLLPGPQPSPESQPQSFFDRAKEFLGNIGSALGR